ncbi:hypothetical protein QOT17_008433 [Balamuthia mandrillaris]
MDFLNKLKLSNVTNLLPPAVALLRGGGQEEEEEDLSTPLPPEYTITTTPKEELLLSSLDPCFYEESFDPMDHLFKKTVPEDMDEAWLRSEIERTRELQNVVDSALSARVLKSYGAFVQGMNQIQQLGLDLHMTAFLCKKARQQLASAKEDLTKSGLTLLGYQRRIQVIETVLNHLISIRSILYMETQLLEALEQGDFPAAIQKCMDAKKRAQAHSQFAAVHALSARLQEHYINLQKKLHQSLLDQCSQFQEGAYERALVGYRLLSKTHRVLEKLQRHYLETITIKTQSVLNAHVFMSEENTANVEKLKQMKFRELCRHLREDHFMSCFLTILECLTHIMFCYHLMCRYHEKANDTAGSGSPSLGSQFKDIYLGLEGFRKTIWAEMQRKVSALISTANLANFQIDEFLRVLGAIKQFIEIGDEFSDSKSHSLIGSIKKQSKAYFIKEHKSRLEDLPTILEAENWVPMPVRPTYSLLDIKELKRFLQRRIKGEMTAGIVNPLPNEASSTSPLVSNATNSLSQDSVFDGFVKAGNPFSALLSASRSSYSQSSKRNDINNDDLLGESQSTATMNGAKAQVEEEEINPALLAQYVDEGDGQQHLVSSTQSSSRISKMKESAEASPLLASTTLRFLQYIGKYLHMMEVLQPISFEVFVGITQLFEYYMHTIQDFFSHEAKTDVAPAPSAQLSQTLSRIRSQIIHGTGTAPEKRGKFSIQSARLSQLVQAHLTSPGCAFGLSERVLGVESLVFMANAMNTVKERIRGLVPRNRHHYFTQFYTTSVDLVQELRRSVYNSVIPLFLDLDNFVTQIAAIKWDIKDVGVQHNAYVSILYFFCFLVHLCVPFGVFPLTLSSKTKWWKTFKSFRLSWKA